VTTFLINAIWDYITQNYPNLEGEPPVKKFWQRVESVFKKLFGSSKWEKTALSVISYIAPILETIIALAVGGPAAAIVTNAIEMAKTDLATMAAVVDGATGTPPPNELQLFVQAENSIRANLGGLLQLAEIKNSGKQAEITNAVNLIVGELDAAVQNLPGAAAPAKA
jgi:hypothetical protein